MILFSWLPAFADSYALPFADQRREDLIGLGKSSSDALSRVPLVKFTSRRDRLGTVRRSILLSKGN